jgi:hypothetical protein
VAKRQNHFVQLRNKFQLDSGLQRFQELIRVQYQIANLQEDCDIQEGCHEHESEEKERKMIIKEISKKILRYCSDYSHLSQPKYLREEKLDTWLRATKF